MDREFALCILPEKFLNLYAVFIYRISFTYEFNAPDARVARVENSQNFTANEKPEKLFKIIRRKLQKTLITWSDITSTLITLQMRDCCKILHPF
jgi:hypothetical protein